MMMFPIETLLSKTSSSCLLPSSVVPCAAVLLLETPSGASYRKCLPKIHFKFSFEVPCSDLSKGSFPDLHLRFVFQIDIARHRDLAKGSFPDSSPSKKKKNTEI